MKISVSDFDNIVIDEPHVFSGYYVKRKKNMLQNLSKRKVNSWKIRWAIAAAVFLVMIIPAGVYAAINFKDFVEGAWGDKGKEDTKPSTTYVTEDEKTVYHAGQDFESVDDEYAEESIIPHIDELGESVKIGNVSMSVNAVLKDELGNAVVEYILKSEESLGNPEYYKGMETVAGDISYSISYGGIGASYCFRDDARSTDTEWYCYAYILRDDSWYNNWLDDRKRIYEESLKTDYETARKYYEEEGYELSKEDYKLGLERMENEIRNAPAPSDIIVRYAGLSEEGEGMLVIRSDKEPLKVKEFSGGGIKAGISPISMRVEGIREYEGDLRIRIEYKDGTEYLVDGDDYINNYGSCYIFDSDNDGLQDYDACQFMFNRLVDTEEVKSIWINSTELSF